MVYNYYLFKQKIIQLIQNSQLNIGEIYFIFKDLLTEIENLYIQQVKNEINTLQQEKRNNQQNQNEENKQEEKE